MESLFEFKDCKNKTIDGAVFFLIGSRIIEFGFTSISLICSATINLCSSLQIKMGLDKF